MDMNIKIRTKRQMKWFLPFYLFTLLLLTSCGEMFELDEENPNQPQMKIDRTSIDIMVGDTYTFNLAQHPDDAKDKAVAWTSANPKVAVFEGEQLKALAAGHTTVTAEWISEKLKASCVVNVIPKWELNPYLYPNDMMVYAKVTVGGRDVDENCLVAAFYDDESDPQNPVSELRGFGELFTEEGITYMALRVFSPDGTGDDLVLRCYDRKSMLIYDCETPLHYSSSGYGTLSDLYEIDF